MRRLVIVAALVALAALAASGECATADMRAPSAARDRSTASRGAARRKGLGDAGP